MGCDGFFDNLLPRDGDVFYLPGFLSEELAGRYYRHFLDEGDWQADEVKLFGKTILTKRKVAWYSKHNMPYRYSGVEKLGLSFTPELTSLCDLIEEKIETSFNACLMNLYHDGLEGMGWHSDDESSLTQNHCIASISLGATRRFRFRHKESKDIVAVDLESGSLLLMMGPVQTFWQHELTKSSRIKDPRINLTFRHMKH